MVINKKRNVFFFAVFLFLGGTVVFAQKAEKRFWNGKRAAVVLTYDDALNSQLDHVIPLLDSLGLKATFYLPGSAKTLRTRLDAWRKAAAEGHELGNHTLFHPCFGRSKDRKWVKPEYDLDNYTLRRIHDEILAENTLLYAIDGKNKRTYAYPCGDETLAGKNVLAGIRKDFVAARGVHQGFNLPGKISVFDLKIYGANRVTGDELIRQVKIAEKQQALLIFLFHGVGGRHPINVTPGAHRKLVLYLKKHENELWVAPLIRVMNFYLQQSVPKINH